MEVTKRNFTDLFPFIQDAISEADFLAIDTELTGLSTHVTEHSFDTISERYLKLRENCMKFIVIQFGLSTFQYHPTQKKYTHKDFNFYVFPRPHIRQSPDLKFMCQTSSLHFLASNGFDFNKVIYDGIQYLSPAAEEKVREFLANKHKIEKDSLNESSSSCKTNGKKEIEVPKEQEQFVADVHKRVEAFLSDENETTTHLDPCNSYQRKLIYETVQQKYPTGLEMSSIVNDKNQRVIAIVKASEEEKHKRLHIKQENDKDDLDSAIGFRKVLDLISQSKKLVVGHNMTLDLMHTLDQFFFSIPESLEEFKEMATAIFPHIADTKVLASSEKLKPFFESTQLGEIFKQLQGKAFELPVIEAAGGFKGYELQSDKSHEAGFDAFMTGFSYIGLTHKLASILKVSPDITNFSSKVISPYLNRMFIMRHYDISTLNLCAPDPEPDRENVFYVSFPQEWKTVDLVELFLPYGNIYVNWLDDVSALVALKSRDNLLNAKTNLLNKPSRLYSVKAFSEYQRAMSKMTSVKKTTDLKRPPNSSNTEAPEKKRRASGNAETMELIPEVEENEAVDDLVSTSHSNSESKSSSAKTHASGSEGPSSKRQKRYQEENDSEVSSTAKVFEEEPW